MTKYLNASYNVCLGEIPYIHVFIYPETMVTEVHFSRGTVRPFLTGKGLYMTAVLPPIPSRNYPVKSWAKKMGLADCIQYVPSPVYAEKTDGKKQMSDAFCNKKAVIFLLLHLSPSFVLRLSRNSK